MLLQLLLLQVLSLFPLLLFLSEVAVNNTVSTPAHSSTATGKHFVGFTLASAFEIVSPADATALRLASSFFICSFAAA
jgi:hypothetical protein